eukprot:m51a1_g12418 hypothetical protein (697) ;mRNA; r:740635-755832
MDKYIVAMLQSKEVLYNDFFKSKQNCKKMSLIATKIIKWSAEDQNKLFDEGSSRRRGESVRAELKKVDLSKLDPGTNELRRLLGDFWLDDADERLSFVYRGGAEQKFRLPFIGCASEGRCATESTDTSKTLETLVDSALEQCAPSEGSIFPVVAKSGAGKTASVFSIGAKHWLIYMVAATARLPFEMDHCFFSMFQKMESAVVATYTQLTGRNIDQPPTEITDGTRHQDTILRRVVEQFMLRQCAARLLVLDEAIKMFGERLTKKLYLALQVNFKLDEATAAAYEALAPAELAAEKFFGALGVNDDLRKCTLLAIDEAQTMAQLNVFLSHTCKAQGRQAEAVLLRPILQPMCDAVVSTGMVVVVMGTAFSLCLSDYVTSYVAKGRTTKVTFFPSCTDPEGDLGKVIDLKKAGCKLSQEQASILRCRYRLVYSVLCKLVECGKKPGQTNQQWLDTAIKAAVCRAKNQLKETIDTALKLKFLRKELLVTLQHNWFLTPAQSGDGDARRCVEIAFDADADLVSAAICSLKQAEDSRCSWVLDELFAAQCLAEMADIKDVAEAAWECISRNVTLKGPHGPQLGLDTEFYIRAMLAGWNGTPVSDLPFVKAIPGTAPSWATSCVINVKRISTAGGFRAVERYPSSARDDMEFILERQPSLMLIEHYLTRADALLFLDESHALIMSSAHYAKNATAADADWL